MSLPVYGPLIVIIVLKLNISRMLSSTENSFFRKEASLLKDEGPRDFTDPKHNKNYKHLGNDIFP
jgi:hypothetical protein